MWDRLAFLASCTYSAWDILTVKTGRGREHRIKTATSAAALCPCSYVEGAKGGQRDCCSFHQRSLLLNQPKSSAAPWERHGFPVREPPTEKQGPCRPGHISYTKKDCIDCLIQHRVDIMQPKGGLLQARYCTKHTFSNPTQSCWDQVRLCVNTEESRNKPVDSESIDSTSLPTPGLGCAAANSVWYFPSVLVLALPGDLGQTLGPFSASFFLPGNSE